MRSARKHYRATNIRNIVWLVRVGADWRQEVAHDLPGSTSKAAAWRWHGTCITYIRNATQTRKANQMNHLKPSRTSALSPASATAPRTRRSTSTPATRPPTRAARTGTTPRRRAKRSCTTPARTSGARSTTARLGSSAWVVMAPGAGPRRALCHALCSAPDPL